MYKMVHTIENNKDNDIGTYSILFKTNVFVRTSWGRPRQSRRKVDLSLSL